MDLRCSSKLHGRLEGKFLEVKCGSRWCGAGPGVVVIHRFSLANGKLDSTQRYKDPRKETR